MYRRVFKQTAIYGIATVVPRMFSFILVPLYTKLLSKTDYGNVNILFAYIIFFNVVLTYGMETAFFRFYNSESNKKSIIETSIISLLYSTILILVPALIFRDYISDFIGVSEEFIIYTIWILALDTLVVIPFALLRVNQQPIKYTVLKILNVAINISLNLFFLKYLSKINENNEFLKQFYFEDYQVGYILISNITASCFTFIVLLPVYFKIKWKFNFKIWKKMVKYSLPILFAGIAFAINEQFDKILLEKLLPSSIAKEEVGVYSACYKLGLFIVLFRTAFSLGIEPFFFSHSANENAKTIYANVTKYFVIFGSFITLLVIVFADLLKVLMIRDNSYWVAMKVVPLIIFANFFLGIYTNLSVWYKVTNKTHIGAYISILGAIITLLLNFILIPFIGYFGSAIATIFAYGTMMIVSYLVGKKFYPIPYDLKSILSYFVLSLFLSSLSFYCFRENYSVSIIFLIIFSIFIYYFEKKTIHRLIKQIFN
jgi:O-antigen/teichoic acid export membrane protein